MGMGAQEAFARLASHHSGILEKKTLYKNMKNIVSMRNSWNILESSMTGGDF
jgi:hypothetical protein